MNGNNWTREFRVCCPGVSYLFLQDPARLRRTAVCCPWRRPRCPPSRTQPAGRNPQSCKVDLLYLPKGELATLQLSLLRTQRTHRKNPNSCRILVKSGPLDDRTPPTERLATSLPFIASPRRNVAWHIKTNVLPVEILTRLVQTQIKCFYKATKEKGRNYFSR